MPLSEVCEYTIKKELLMGNFQREPVMPPETHVGYVEGYLDALEKVRSFSQRNPDMPIADICFALEVSLRTTIVGGDGIVLPTDLSQFPSTARLLGHTSSH
jgi:hypothetical protein